MIEVEVKLKIRDYDVVRNYLQNHGYDIVETLIETDSYYDDSNGLIRKSDSALRIRCTEDEITGNKKSVVTFKGPKMDNKSMTRQEAETEVGDGKVLNEILEALGFSSVEPKVIKHREQFKRDFLNACLDRVEGLGDFLELEILIDDSPNAGISGNKQNPDTAMTYTQALEIIEQELNALGYSIEDTTNISYLTQLQSK